MLSASSPNLAKPGPGRHVLRKPGGPGVYTIGRHPEVGVALSMFEEIVLLGLDDATGKCISSYAQYSWKAGVLAELLLSECIAIGDRDIQVRCTETGSDDILEE